MHVAIIDYGSGNLHSAAKAFERAAREGGLGARHQGHRPPGGRGRRRPHRASRRRRLCRLQAGPRGGPRHDRALWRRPCRQRGKPFLGICVGLQLMAERGLEHGVTPGLGWIKGEVRAIAPSDPDAQRSRIWAGTRCAWSRRASACSKAFPTGEGGLHAYFVHSYHLVPPRRRPISWRAPITAARSPPSSPRTTWPARQFHPEKSQKLGLALIANFLRWKP